MIQLKQPFINGYFGFQLLLTIVYPRVTDFPFVFIALLTNGTCFLMGPPVSCRTPSDEKSPLPRRMEVFGVSMLDCRVDTKFGQNSMDISGISRGPSPQREGVPY